MSLRGQVQDRLNRWGGGQTWGHLEHIGTPDPQWILAIEFALNLWCGCQFIDIPEALNLSSDVFRELVLAYC